MTSGVQVCLNPKSKAGVAGQVPARRREANQNVGDTLCFGECHAVS
eukprot:CAMPEP_0194545456 /NCGR_PEP_ID=MMETSP0253-20130528/89213_1 /TAXON_ID=2966 /ORGANISM="Noctiluca scintillans" /LENGTH=45 /DNA_ID= /DNA_START= /DNA_END= /DNA_ORIENTATION=